MRYVAAPEHTPENAMVDPDEIGRFYDRCSDLMRALLDGLALQPDRPRPFPHIEDALGWPRRRIASVLGGVCHLRQMEFSGRRPYHFREPRHAASRRWEMWMDAAQAEAVRAEQRAEPPAEQRAEQPVAR
jgi:hypothetical protein